MTFPRPHLSLLTGFILTTTLTLAAQAPEPTKSAAEPTSAKKQQPPDATTITRIFHVKSTTQTQDQIELLNFLNSVSDPRDHITFLRSQNVIVMEAPADHIAKAEKLIDELDKPKRAYRLTYTLIDFDGTKRLGDQHYSMVLVSGQRTVLKQGNRVPIVTGTDLKDPNNPQTQYTYLDIGMNFDATIDDAPNSLRLKAKIEQSSVVENHSNALPQEPVIRQSLFEGSAVLTPGKPIVLGSLDISGTTRRIEIQATVEQLTP
jgi:type II secretory pathway component GspD/PulD (secretin)